MQEASVVSHKRNLSKASEQDIERLREKAKDEIITKLMDELRDEDPLSLGIQHDLTACGESTVDVYGPVTIPLEKVMEEDRIREERRRKFLNVIADINVRLRTTRNPILKRLLKSQKRKLIEQVQHFESMPQTTIIEDEVPVITPYGQTIAARRHMFMTEDERWQENGMERGKSVENVLGTEREELEKRWPHLFWPEQERAKQQREEEQRRQEEAEKEQQFRLRQIDRYLGDLKAIDMEDSTVEEIEQFISDFEPHDEDEEILVSNLHKLLEKVRHDRGR